MFAINWVTAAPKGSIIYVIQRHVSASGMTRILDPFVIVDGDIRYLRSLADIDGMPFKRNTRSSHDGFVVHGSGMDMHFHFVYSLGMFIHHDGYYFNHRTV